jgi:N-acetylmuramoyl-L-alanine amidase CwlA
MKIISRAEWSAEDPERPLTPWDPSLLHGVTVHHFASPSSAAMAAGSARLMQGVQRSHKAGEFTDIAYNFCFDKFGQVFEGRGFGFQTGANGTTDANRHYASICYMGDSDKDGFPEQAQKAAAWLLLEWFKRGTDRVVVPHRKWTGSTCPGAAAHAWVVNGGWKADLPQAKKVRWELWDDEKLLSKSATVPVEDSAERLKAFLGRVGGTIDKVAAAEGNLGRVQLRRRVIG